MKYLHQLITSALICFIFVFAAGCSKKEEQVAEETQDKGKIEQMTDQAAETAVRKIRTPQDKARATRDLGNEREELMDKVLQQQAQ